MKCLILLFFTSFFRSFIQSSLEIKNNCRFFFLLDFNLTISKDFNVGVSKNPNVLYLSINWFFLIRKQD